MTALVSLLALALLDKNANLAAGSVALRVELIGLPYQAPALGVRKSKVIQRRAWETAGL